MNFGNLSGLVNGTEQVVFDYEVTGSAVSSIPTGNILNGDEDGWYTIIVRHIGAVDQYNIEAQINGDSGSNYGNRGIQSVNTVVQDDFHSGYSALFMTLQSSGIGNTSFAVHKLYAKSGSVRLMNSFSTGRISGTTVYGVEVCGQVWNNSVDNITSITFNNLSGLAMLGVGTRITILKSNNFTNGTPTGVINTPYIQGAWTRVASRTLDAPNVEIIIPDLNGNRDVIYRVVTSAINNVAANNPIYLQINGEAINTYGYQRMYSQNTSVYATREIDTPGFEYGWLYSAGGNNSLSEAFIFAKSGFVRPVLITYAGCISGTTIGTQFLSGGSWSNTADNLTTLRVSTGQANGFAAGTSVEVYALRPNG